MTSPVHLAPRAFTGPHGLRAIVSAPEAWVEQADDQQIILSNDTPWQSGFQDRLSIAFAPGLGITLDQWARVTRTAQNESIVDLHVLHEQLRDGEHRRSLLATIEPGVTVIVHEVRTVVGADGLTVALTTLPGADVHVAATIDDMLSRVILERNDEGTA